MACRQRFRNLSILSDNRLSACTLTLVETAPKYGDSDNTLLAKICQNLANRHAGAKAPKYGDSKNRLLAKIAYNLVTYGL